MLQRLILQGLNLRQVTDNLRWHLANKLFSVFGNRKNPSNKMHKANYNTVKLVDVTEHSMSIRWMLMAINAFFWSLLYSL